MPKAIQISVVKTRWADMSPSTLSRVAHLTLDHGSVMKALIRRKNKSDRIFLAYHRRRIVGWATVDHFNTKSSRFYTVNVYVEPAFRERGVASQLSSRIKEDTVHLKKTVLFPSLPSRGKKFEKEKAKTI